MYCSNGKHELILMKDQCPFCENEKLRRQLAAAEIAIRAMKSIKYGTEQKSEIQFTTEQVNRIAVEVLQSIERVEQFP